MSINGIEVTDVIIFPIKSKEWERGLNAYAKVILNDQFIITGIRVVEGKNGPFISFPSNTNKTDGKRWDICFPTTAELRAYITEQVLTQYSLVMESQAA
jgi:stage V sporulation protein G